MILLASYEGGCGCVVENELGRKWARRTGERGGNQQVENQHRGPALQGKEVGAWSQWRPWGWVEGTHSGYTEVPA